MLGLADDIPYVSKQILCKEAFSGLPSRPGKDTVALSSTFKSCPHQFRQSHVQDKSKRTFKIPTEACLSAPAAFSLKHSLHSLGCVLLVHHKAYLIRL